MSLCARMLALEWKERAFIEKMNSRWFCWFPAAIFVYQNCTQIWRLHTKPYKRCGNVSANNSETVGHEDLRLGQIVYILVFYNISFSWLLPLDGFQFIFWRRVYYVTVETINPFVRNVRSGAGESTADRAPPAIAVNKLPPVLTFICSFSLWFS